MQTLEAFEPLLAMGPTRTAERRAMDHQVCDAIATHRVADRPDRCEPRRKGHYGWLTTPRAELKRQMARGVGKK